MTAISSVLSTGAATAASTADSHALCGAEVVVLTLARVDGIKVPIFHRDLRKLLEAAADASGRDAAMPAEVSIPDLLGESAASQVRRSCVVRVGTVT